MIVPTAVIQYIPCIPGRRLGDEGVKVVADVLKLNQTLRSLKLQGVLSLVKQFRASNFVVILFLCWFSSIFETRFQYPPPDFIWMNI